MSDIFNKLEKELPNYIHQIKGKSNSEAKVLHEFTSFIQKVFDIEAKDLDFEVAVKSSVKQVKGRIDAVFSNIILEFKKNLKDSRALITAQEELEKYFQSLYEKDSKNKHIGIATDGLNFKVYQAIIENNQVSKLELINEISLDTSSTEIIFNWFDSYFFASSQIAPTSEHLKQMFGLNSPSYAVIKNELLELFDKVKNNRRIKTKYDNWERFLEIVYGDKPNELNLFISHTYLSTFAKLLVYLKLTSKNKFRNYDVLPILYGNVFSQLGIRNFVEDDFFTWTMFITIRKQSSKIFERILRDLEVYDLDKMDEDVLKELYQEMVRPDVRKQLGEFYTPDWLADKMVLDVLSKDPSKSVLDPSCGSGTFLFKTNLYKIKRLKEDGMSDLEILSHILENVIGFDIHPLAALIAKTNYLLSLRGIILARTGPITIPVYLSDSLKIPDKKNEITNSIPTFQFSTGILDKTFSFPENLADDLVKMDDVIEKMKEHGQELEENMATINESSYNISFDEVSKNLKQSFERSISNIKDHNEKEILMKNIQTLFDLIKKDADSIWPYVLRNMYKPLAISKKKVDIILGNPPWLALQFMKNPEYQNFVKTQSRKYKLIDKIQNITHLELATVFFSHSVETYLKKNGHIAFVMPRSVLVASQHDNFIKFENPNVQLEKIYDLEESKQVQVSPLFKIPSCVLFAKNNATTKYPVEKIIFNGKLDTFNSQWDEAKKNIQMKKSTYQPAIRNITRSYYFDKFSQGATIVPGSLWFIEIKNDQTYGFNPLNPLVISEFNSNAKKPWSEITMEENVDKEFLFTTIVSNDLIPFGYRRRKLLVLPVLLKNGTPKLIDNSKQLDIIQKDISKYLKKAEDLWQKFGTDKSKKMSIYERLNYQNGITRQKLNSKYKVLYVSSATYITSCVVKTEKPYELSINGNNISISNLIADSTTYSFDTDDEDEAYYLSSFLNSIFLDELIKPHQARGSFGGARHIHKIPLTFEIPKFDRTLNEHKILSKLGKNCHDKSKINMDSIRLKSIGKIRSLIRNSLKDEFIEIDKIVKNILGF